MADIKKTIEVLITAKNQSGPGFKNASEDAKVFADIVGKTSRFLVGGGIGLVSSLATTAIAAARSADGIRDLGQQSGLTATEVSRLKYVAEQSGTSVEGLAESTRFLNRIAYDAYKGSKEAASGFKDLGVSVTDSTGKMKSSQALLLDTVDALSKVENEQRRANLSAQLLGRGSGDLAEFIKLGRDQIVAMTHDADRLGATLDPLAADAADLFGDRVSSAKAAAGGLAQTISAPLLPRLSDLVNGLTDVIAKTTEFVRKNPDLVNTAATAGGVAVAAGAALGVVSNMATITSGVIDTLKDGSAAAKAFFGFILSGAGAATLGITALIGTVGLLLVALKRAKDEAKVGEQVTDRLKADPDAERLQAIIDNPSSSYDARLSAAQKLKDIVDGITRQVRNGDLPTSPDRLAEVNAITGGAGRVGYGGGAVAGGGQPSGPPFASGAPTTVDEAAYKISNAVAIEIQGRGARGNRDGNRPGPGGPAPGFNPVEPAINDPGLAFSLNVAEQIGQKAAEGLASIPSLASTAVNSLVSLGDVAGNFVADGFRISSQAAAQWAKSLIASIVSVIAKAAILAGLLGILGLGGGASFGTLFKKGLGIPGLASGGIVRGGVPGQDSVLAALMPGELVIPAPLTRELTQGLSGRAAAAPPNVIQVTMPVQYYFGRETDAREAAVKIQRQLDELQRGTRL